MTKVKVSVDRHEQGNKLIKLLHKTGAYRLQAITVVDCSDCLEIFSHPNQEVQNILHKI